MGLDQCGRSVVGLPESEDSFKIGDDWCPSDGLLHDIDKLYLSLGVIKVILQQFALDHACDCLQFGLVQG